MLKFLENIVDWQTSITPSTDKLSHFFWGFWYALAGLILDMRFESYLVIVIPFVLGVGNEIRNYYGKGKSEVLDAVFTIAPSIIISLINFIK